jgi:uncharacterized membrane protein YdjX (TVP38/TMEM64 family)
MYKKLSIAILYLGIAYIIYVYGELILDWIEHARIEHIPITATVATIMALFPIIPYPIVGGFIGAAYGPALGGFVTWLGSTLASLIMFLVVRYGYQDWGLHILHKYRTLGKLTILFEKNAFLTILFTRLIPIIPSIIVNIYSALSRVSFVSYALASSIGKIPAMLLFALVGDQLLTNPKNIIIIIVVYGVFLAVTFYFYNLWKKNNLRKNS